MTRGVVPGKISEIPKGSEVPGRVLNRTGTPIVAIGASTGGPAVLRALIQALPDKCNAAVVIVQHIDARFLPSFVEWLSESSGKVVQIAEPGTRLAAGAVYLAGSQHNLEILSDGSIAYRPCALDQLYCPGVDNFFRSLRGYPKPGLAVLLTGMGADGAEGLAELAACGWHTVVQSPESCVVSGMPDAALRLSRRHSVLSPEQIGRIIRTATFDFSWSR